MNKSPQCKTLIKDGDVMAGNNMLSFLEEHFLAILPITFATKINYILLPCMLLP